MFGIHARRDLCCVDEMLNKHWRRRPVLRCGNSDSSSPVLMPKYECVRSIWTTKYSIRKTNTVHHHNKSPETRLWFSWFQTSLISVPSSRRNCDVERMGRMMNECAGMISCFYFWYDVSVLIRCRTLRWEPAHHPIHICLTSLWNIGKVNKWFLSAGDSFSAMNYTDYWLILSIIDSSWAQFSLCPTNRHNLLLVAR